MFVKSFLVFRKQICAALKLLMEHCSYGSIVCGVSSLELQIRQILCKWGSMHRNTGVTIVRTISISAILDLTRFENCAKQYNCIAQFFKAQSLWTQNFGNPLYHIIEFTCPSYYFENVFAPLQGSRRYTQTNALHFQTQ